ncbi:MAG TPA: SRPBCC family protein [Thermoplasmata archaeon]|nr:SRPBCC family protein [Thermoplasmata archaeon]
MPNVAATLNAPGSVAQVFQVLTDPDFLAATIPGVISMQNLSPTQAIWKVEVKQGLIHRELTFQVEHSPTPPEKVAFVAVAPEVRIEGVLQLRPKDAAHTEVALTVSYEGQGPLRYVINSLVAKSMKEYPAAFESKLIARLTAPAVG